MQQDKHPLLDIRHLVVEFAGRRKAAAFKANNDISLCIAPGQTMGLIGESGSGKSTLGRAVLGLVPVASGTVHFEGRDITHAPAAQRRGLSADLQVVFQDPYSSLNPTKTIGQTLAQPLLARGATGIGSIPQRIASVLSKVGLPASAAERYPANFSGGQRQRVAIARALMRNPKLIICDEPVAALDLSIQAQIINLLNDLKADFGVGYLFIAHDLTVVAHLADRVTVLYRGEVMETGVALDVYRSPQHPYTQALVAASPVADPQLQRERRLARKSRLAQPDTGQASSGNGCPFAGRCPQAMEACRSTRPGPRPRAGGGTVACHLIPASSVPHNAPADAMALALAS